MQAIENGVIYAVRQGLIWREGDFLWHDFARKISIVRSYANLPDYSRSLEQIAPEEIMLAIETVVESAFGMQRDDIPTEVCNLFGFGRTSQAMREHVDAIISKMISAELLVEQGNFLVSSKEG